MRKKMMGGGMMSSGMMDRPMYKKGGKTLKKVPTGKKGKGLKKLPKAVRNKIGFKKDGGKIK